MLHQFGQSQICHGNEVGRSEESPGRVLGLLQHPVHRLTEGVSAVVDHAAHHGVESVFCRARQLLVRIQPASARLVHPAPRRLALAPWHPDGYW